MVAGLATFLGRNKLSVTSLFKCVDGMVKVSVTNSNSAAVSIQSKIVNVFSILFNY